MASALLETTQWVAHQPRRILMLESPSLSPRLLFGIHEQTLITAEAGMPSDQAISPCERGRSRQ